MNQIETEYHDTRWMDTEGDYNDRKQIECLSEIERNYYNLPN